ncbi:MAG: hypothetical protein Q4B63_01865 [Clostridium perfringens]|nr:hypothetical protein [Clostridium perfringens]
MGNLINYYGMGNTAKGGVNFYKSIFQGLDKIYGLKGGTSAYKTQILRKLSDSYSKNYDVDVINSSIDINKIEGIIVKNLNLAIVDLTPIHGIKPINDKVQVIEVDLTKAENKNILKINSLNLNALKKSFNDNIKRATKEYEKALEIHDIWETFYISNMNFKKINKLTVEIIAKIVPKEELKDTLGRTYDRYLGAATPIGSKDYVVNLTDGLKRYFIKGRPGTGKSTILKKIAHELIEKGYDIEVYHCGFDPNSLDMVICRSLNFAIFDSTSPHEYFPDKDSDELIDVYKEAVNEGTDEKYIKELNEIKKRYKGRVMEGTKYLALAKVIVDKIEAVYAKAFKEEVAEEIIKRYLKSI